MIGYDRPLKAEWIYKSLQLVEAGHNPKDYYEGYDDIAVELTGKDGRRKTRTVLFRTFIFNFQEKTSIIEDNMLIKLCKDKSFDYMKPILLSKFILDYEILNQFSNLYSKIFDDSQEISTKAITARMIDSFGDAEIIKRSTRAFLKTLHSFGVIEPLNSTIYSQLPKLELSIEQVKDILLLYAVSNHTKQIDLKHLDKSLFAYYKTPSLSEIANKYHTNDWEYIRGSDRELLMLR
jgi:hypothetical protein